MAARSLSVAQGVASRSARKLRKSPPRAVPPLVIPLFMFIAFTGALSAVAGTSGFKYYDYTAFQFVFVLYVAAIFSGVFTAFEIASDYETGMGARLMLAVPQRLAIVAGYVLFALGRAAVAIAFIWAIALATGMPVRGEALEIAGFVALALLLNLATTLYGAGIALRFQSTAAGSLIFIPVFMLLFLTPLFAPRDQISGWLRTAADVNPLTAPIEAGRGFLADDPVRVGAAFGTAGGLVVAFAVWAALGMRKAEQGPRAGGGPRARRQRTQAGPSL
jgi:ABC-2 type transport system permease protein